MFVSRLTSLMWQNAADDDLCQRPTGSRRPERLEPCRTVTGRPRWPSWNPPDIEPEASAAPVALAWCGRTGWVSEQCLTSPPTQYRLYGRRFLQVKRPNQQYQSTEGESTKENNTKNIKKTDNTHTQNSIQITVTQTNTASPLVYNNMGWLGDSSHRGQVR